MDFRMVELKTKLNEILAFIKDKRDVIFIDYPAHHNVGDLLIFQGTMEFFKENKVNVKVFRSVVDYHPSEIKKFITPNTTILCHGGGNFGDIYPLHQKLREDVVQQFPENRIIVLPQTAYYSNDNHFDKSCSILSKHSDLILFARDQRTLEIFSRISDKAYLSPDMAHALYGKYNKSKDKNKNKLFFLRVDGEINDCQGSLIIPSNYSPMDWEDFITNSDKLFRKVINYIFRLSNVTNSSVFKNFAAKLWCFHCKRLVSRSFIFFSQFDEVITSRMHGHILACLVDVPNRLIDNSYGKNSGYYNEWTSKVLVSSLFDESK